MELCLLEKDHLLYDWFFLLFLIDLIFISLTFGLAIWTVPESKVQVKMFENFQLTYQYKRTTRLTTKMMLGIKTDANMEPNVS